MCAEQGRQLTIIWTQCIFSAKRKINLVLDTLMFLFGVHKKSSECLPVFTEQSHKAMININFKKEDKKYFIKPFSPPDLVYESWQLKRCTDTLIVVKQKAKLVKWFWKRKRLARGTLKVKNMHLCNIQNHSRSANRIHIKKEKDILKSQHVFAKSSSVITSRMCCKSMYISSYNILKLMYVFA